jgi:hypothetical protein
MNLQSLLKIYRNKCKPCLQSKLLILVFLFFVLPLSIFAQSRAPAMDKLAVELNSLGENVACELVYLQTSKSIYETGEDLWFKAYILHSQFFTPSILSKTLYLQVINERTNQQVWQEKYEIKNGFVNGHVFLQDTLSEGDYLLEAFTGQSFFNDSAEFKAIRKITVKKNMNSRPSFSIAFNKLFYNPGDSIEATITASSENGKPLYAEVEATLLEGDRKLGQAQSVTNHKGEAKIAFVLQSFGKELRVVAHLKYTDKQETLSFPVPHKKGSPIQFDVFPEGGDLVAGAPNKLAFKAVDIDGNPLDVEGTLFEDLTPLIRFKSVHAGMGSLDFIPFAGKKYHIRLSEPATDSTFQLPDILTEGITMRLAGRDKEYLDFIVSQSEGEPERLVYLRGQMRGVVYCMAGGKLQSELKIKIPLREFPQQGIAEFTLFDENLRPVAERLVYIHSGKKLYIKTELDKAKYETREKVILKIKVTDENGLPVTASLGVSVSDKLYQNHGDPINILAYCYLSSQLKGNIYNPAYYFDEKNEKHEQALDLLLLTQGWRRYVWSAENMKATKEKQLPAIFDWTEGEVRATRKLKRSQSMQQLVKAFNPGKNEVSDFIVAGSSGKFIVSPVHLKTWQGEYVYLKPMAPEEFEPRISLSNSFQIINDIMGTKERNYPLPGVTDTMTEEPFRPFVAAPNVIELGEITIKGRAINPFRDKYLGQLDSISKLTINDHWVCSHGFLHNYKQGYAHLVGSGPPYKICSDTIVKRPVEGELYELVKYEDVGRQDGKWILTDLTSITYHYPKFTEEELLKLHNLSRVTAYYSEREFYQPTYDKETEKDFLPDTRNTLVWAPSVVTDESGEATLEFFCSDVNTGFIGMVEGVSGDGLPGTMNFEFTVQKLKPFKWEMQE